MPRQSLQLNDFSGGLNTKSSPRDIAPNQVQLAENVFLSNPGLVEATSNATTKHDSAPETMTHTKQGNGAFIFNSEHNVDTTGGASINPSQIIAYPIDDDGNTNIQFFRRDFDTTENFTFEGTDTEIDMGVTGGVEPVYYFVDGLLYVSDKLVVKGTNSSEPKKLVYVEDSRFGVDITGWYPVNVKVETDVNQFHSLANNSLAEPDLKGEFSVSLQTDPTLDSQIYTEVTEDGDTDNKLVVTSNPNELNPDPTYDIGITDKLIHLKLSATAKDMDTLTLAYDGQTGNSGIGDSSGNGNRTALLGKIIYINQEAMRVRSTNLLDLSVADDNKILQLLVDRDVFGTGTLEHAAGDVVETVSTTSITVTGGGWESGSYEFCHTVVDLQDNETLPQTPKSDLFAITTGAYFTNVGFIIRDASFDTRKNEKGVRIYTRKKDGNGRWILFLDVDYQRGVRTNLFEDYIAFLDGQGTDGNFAQVTGIDIVNPSLDTYESINGYSQDEESVDFGTDGGYKAATICARRAWVANVRKNDKVYDDRVYYSPVNRFSTFPDSNFLDIGINDGDSFTALHSLGNRLLAFKQRKLYVINISSSSDAGWYLEAEYDGMGCRQQESVCKTPFGVCWVNDDGVYIFDGQSTPKELTVNLDDATWRTNQSTKNPAIGYNNKYKQLNVVQDTAADTDVLVFDFPTQGWSLTKSIGSSGISNFLPSFDGLYYLEYGSSNTKTVKLLTGDVGTKLIDLRTKDIDFGNPGLVKRVKKVYVTVKNENHTATDTTQKQLILSYAKDGTEDYTDLTAQTIDSDKYKTLIYTINQDVESIALKLTTTNVNTPNTGTLNINDINIDYRQTNKRPS